MSTHTHRCGLTALGELEGYGCGHEWSHDDRLRWDWMDHYCPVCGRGPFTVQVGGPWDVTRAAD